jgi:hypothetical protein
LSQGGNIKGIEKEALMKCRGGEGKEETMEKESKKGVTQQCH